ncbi:uncharacterized protein CTHT_0018640 [Thermochaetoides thermophila DSM 1495]|uniref:Peptidase M4 C-terminal domain-containing protein n=1 Tax=Chaetomium thermophilum (strain DSM 1495 / CBS 144.50 / IMI 039719) TaxID=759272 RepID=G0S2V7_CHATD|nr:hypothetical protein CTHT_0018640 [Thermochaetoides thermophila DSM 1495]EGS22340.1 hypothetical protein CTHT_0018640 [Thermochaetoides thermophila DSM 1495]
MGTTPAATMTRKLTKKIKALAKENILIGDKIRDARVAHAVLQYNSPLIYRNESGALNENIADVFGIIVKQLYENEDAEHADWLVGEGC